MAGKRHLSCSFRRFTYLLLSVGGCADDAVVVDPGDVFVGCVLCEEGAG